MALVTLCPMKIQSSLSFNSIIGYCSIISIANRHPINIRTIIKYYYIEIISYKVSAAYDVEKFTND